MKIVYDRLGLKVPAMGFGLLQLAPDQPDATAFAVMTEALEHGLSFFDTADRYHDGENENLLGRFLRTVERDKVTVCTKYGSLASGPDGLPAVNNDPAYIAEACEASLKRLGVEVIDLYYMHRRDPSVPIAESVGAMSRLVEEGKVRALGLSEVAASTLREAHEVHPIAAVQSEYSLWHRDLERDVIPTCRELGIMLVPFSPLGRSFLAGTMTETNFKAGDLRATLPRFQPDAMAKNQQLVDELKGFAAERGVSPAQVALAFVVAKSTPEAPVVPIPGTKTIRYIAQNAAALELTLSPDEIGWLETLFAADRIVGERYSPVEAARAGL